MTTTAKIAPANRSLSSLEGRARQLATLRRHPLGLTAKDWRWATDRDRNGRGFGGNLEQLVAMKEVRRVVRFDTVFYQARPLFPGASA